MTKWGLRFKMEKLPKVYEDHLEADINYFKAHLKMEAYKDLKMLDKTKAKLNDLSDKHFMLKGLGAGAAGIDMVKGFTLDTIAMDEFVLMEFRVIREEEATILEIEFDETYFELWKQLRDRSKFHRFSFRNKLTDKKTMRKEFKKQIKNEYTKEFEIEEYEKGDDNNGEDQ